MLCKLCFHTRWVVSWPPTSHTAKLVLLCTTVSTLKRMVGSVITVSPSFSLNNMVVWPGAPTPTMTILFSLLHGGRPQSFANVEPILLLWWW